MKEDILIHKLEINEQVPYSLLLLADPSKKNIDAYLPGSDLYVAKHAGEVIGCYVLSSINTDTTEIKNIAVDEKHQGKGLGTLLLHDAIAKATSGGYKKIIIGTGNSSIGQLYLYQKTGFRITGIRTNFFIDNYEDPIIENGIECRDMIVLTKEL